MLPVGIEVEGARHELLTRAALTLNQDGRIGIRDLRDEIVNLLHPRGGADDVFEPVLLLYDLPQITNLATVVLMIERALDESWSSSTLNGFSDVIVGAHLHRLDARLQHLARR